MAKWYNLPATPQHLGCHPYPGYGEVPMVLATGHPVVVGPIIAVLPLGRFRAIHFISSVL